MNAGHSAAFNELRGGVQTRGGCLMSLFSFLRSGGEHLF